MVVICQLGLFQLSDHHVYLSMKRHEYIESQVLVQRVLLMARPCAWQPLTCRVRYHIIQLMFSI